MGSDIVVVYPYLYAYVLVVYMMFSQTYNFCYTWKLFILRDTYRMNNSPTHYTILYIYVQQILIYESRGSWTFTGCALYICMFCTSRRRLLSLLIADGPIISLTLVWMQMLMHGRKGKQLHCCCGALVVFFNAKPIRVHETDLLIRVGAYSW